MAARVRTPVMRTEVLSERAETLKLSRAAYMGQMTKLYNEMENLMLDFDNYQAVIKKKDSLNEAFEKLKPIQLEYADVLSHLEQTEHLNEASAVYESVVKNKLEFDQRLLEWNESRHRQRHLTDPSHKGSSSSSRSSKVSSRVSEKIKETKVKAEVARLKLKQLSIEEEMKHKQMIYEQEQERKKQESESQCNLLKVKNEVDCAELEARLWEEEYEKWDNILEEHANKLDTSNVSVPLLPTVTVYHDQTLSQVQVSDNPVSVANPIYVTCSMTDTSCTLNSTVNNTQPAYAPVTQPAYAPVTQPAYAPVTQPAYAPVTQPAYAPVTQPAYAPVTQPAYAPVTQPAYAPVTQPAYAPVTQPAYAPVTQPAYGTGSRVPITQPAYAPVTQPAYAPVTQPAYGTGSRVPITQPAYRDTSVPPQQPYVNIASMPQPAHGPLQNVNPPSLDAIMYASMIQGINMPKREFMYFDGDPVNYPTFMRNFEINVENQVQDDCVRLTYLIQFCTGKAKSAIKDCVILPPSQGYQQAKSILFTNFGQRHIVVQNLIQKCTKGPVLKPQQSQGLSQLARDMKNALLCCRQMGYSGDLNSFDTMTKVVKRLPLHLQGEWAKEAGKKLISCSDVTFEDLSTFLETRALIANSSFGMLVGARPEKPSNNRHKASPAIIQRVTTLATTATQSKQDTKGCLFCGRNNHNLTRCFRFPKIPHEERRDFTRKHKLCNLCLSADPPHFAKDCKSKRMCTVDGCGRRHHTALHWSLGASQSRSGVPSHSKDVNTDAPPTDAVKSSVNFGKCHQQRRTVLPVLPVRVCNPDSGQEISTYAFLDSGSDTSMCLSSLAERLGIEGEPVDYKLTTVNAEKTIYGRKVQLDLKHLSSNEGIMIDQLLTTNKLPVSSEQICNAQDASRWPHLKDVNIEELEDKKVEILIGCDVPEAHWLLDERRGKRQQPVGIKTILGWTIMGPVCENGTKITTVSANFIHLDQTVNCSAPIECMESVSTNLERMWTTEFSENLADVKDCVSMEDRRARDIMERSAVFIDGHYQIGLPWKYDHPCLPNNLSMAKKRINLLKRRFQRDPALFISYKATMTDYIEKGHARVLTEEDTTSEVKWYVPHHPVFNPNKPNKVRVVFDCAARFGNTSLNDQLLQGPNLTSSLLGVLLRFRQERIAVVSDIEQMFHQVRVKPSDCGAFSFLWWPDGDLSKEPTDHQMLVHLFGASSSPSCASYALQKTAHDNRKDFDIHVIGSVYKNFYVDDLLKSVSGTEEAKSFISQITELMSRGGFHLTKWVSNHREVLESIPASERASSVVNLDLEKLPSDRTLGVQWNVESDTFGFKIKNEVKRETRRGILSYIAAMYDPLGYAAPFVLPGKQILQQLCRAGYSWDEELSQDYLSLWRKWQGNLSILNSLEIPRCFKPPLCDELQSIELHCFSDASLSGYGVCTYLRFVDTSGRIHCSLVLGKSRVAPLKTMTIPRLELTAAVTAVKVSKQVQEELQIPIHSVTFWTDSTIVLQYIRNTSKRFQTFVANRLQIIHDASSPSQWRYISSGENVADYASRGIHLDQPNEDAIQTWLNGPKFLWKPEHEWPEQPEILHDIPSDDRELKKGQTRVCLSLITEFPKACEDKLEEMVNRFSQWYNLQKAVAWLLRFKSYLQNRDKVNTGPLTVVEITQATHEIVKIVQRKVFLRDISKEMPSEKINAQGYLSPLRKLNPFQQDGVLRVGGRLQQADLDESRRHPMILPSYHHVTDLVVRHYHEKEGHIGANHVLSVIRQQFWIVQGLKTVKRVIGRCIVCKRWSSHPIKQVMAPLPMDRVTPGEPPFSCVGVDYFGPLQVKWRRGTAKRYGCLFTCLAVRAVHIEIAHSLSTDSFIQAFCRFVSRRGAPRKIYSDNGTNFKGAEQEIKKAMQQWDCVKIENKLRQNDIQWYFNAPSASHTGGVWERMIRSIRKILCSILGNQLVDDETLMTVLTEVEKILNSRPLSPVSDDPRDLEPISPSSLLLLRPNVCVSPDVEGDYFQDGWKRAQQLADQFWDRWLKEYLPTLQERQKWLRPKRNLQVGDLVLIIDENAPRGCWPKALVQQVFPDRFGHVRQVMLKTSKGQLRRDVRKLCLLEMSV
ncbi:uncharacterized protein LOC106154518 [Lingula anatina]|uniref:Uncharacterized protein LOC106154518 n=1 Tax=Lingula anatina TaxID=7574 RepID=A0A1S3HH31_LINAN|nr:uncharacterized protein LOC106154518 [Lingula anatina]|eukprot:XP_013384334.1 uncharacterized protein LOC106154518 [Lingula anatina]